jgi:hypothetical protein
LSATGSGLQWYMLSSGGTSSSNAPTPSTTTTGTTDYYVSQTVNGCEGSRATISITINALPIAEITPSGPTTFVDGGSVTLNANIGSGLSYKWFNGTTQVGTGPSYQATAAGNYAVEVSNASGCRVTSPATEVNITTNQPSVITITSPTPNTTLIGAITITATISDPDGGITLVEFLDGTTVIGTSTTAPYSFTWDNPGTGDHSISVRVTDSNGGVTTSSPTTVTVGTSTGISSTSYGAFTHFYPNPTLESFTVKASQGIKNLSVVNMYGVEVAALQDLSADQEVEIGKDIAAGTYVLLIKYDSDKMEVAKVVKIK